MHKNVTIANIFLFVIILTGMVYAQHVYQGGI